MMKSQNGVTMITLILYIASFAAITAVVAGITTFFYNNVEILDTSVGSNSQYNKLNLYILNECKKEGNHIVAWKNTESGEGIDNNYNTESTFFSGTGVGEGIGKDDAFIKFSEGTTDNRFIYVASENNLYYNKIKLCDKVEDFKIKVDNSAGKSVLKVYLNIDGTAFSTEYVVGS